MRDPSHRVMPKTPPRHPQGPVSLFVTSLTAFRNSVGDRFAGPIASAMGSELFFFQESDLEHLEMREISSKFDYFMR